MSFNLQSYFFNFKAASLLSTRKERRLLKMGNQPSSALVLVEKAGEGDIEAVQSLLNQKLVDVNVCDEDGRTALFMAAMRGHTRVVELLLGYLPEVSTDTEGQRVEKLVSVST